MVSEYLSGGEACMRKLEDIAHKMNAGAVEIGFLENATYGDGTLVALVAWWNEFGRVIKTKLGFFFQVPRPFFRRMIAKNSPAWPDTMGQLARDNDYDGKKVLGLMGVEIKGQLETSIQELQDPPLAPATVEAKGFDKPLIDSNTMVNSIDYRLVDE